MDSNYQFVEVERGSFGSKSGLEDNTLRLSDSGLALSQNLRRFFKIAQITDTGKSTLYRAKVFYDPNRIAFRIVEAGPEEGFAFHGKNRAALQGRMPSHLERLNPERGKYRLVEEASDENQLIFRKEQ